MILFIFRPDIALSGGKNAIFLWATAVLPSLFPFFVLTYLLLRAGAATIFSKCMRPVTALLHLPPMAAYPFAMSLLCGFPTGTKLCRAMEKELSPGETESAYLCCFSSGPLFIVGTVGCGMLGNKAEGLLLLQVHWMTALLFASLQNFCRKGSDSVCNADAPFSFDLGEAVWGAVRSILRVGGFMLFFGVLLEFPKELFRLPPFFLGLAEFTCGIAGLAETHSLPEISFLLSFGGCCILCQCFAEGAINKPRFFLARLISGSISYFLCMLAQRTFLWMPSAVTVTVLLLLFAARQLYARYLLKAARSSSVCV